MTIGTAILGTAAAALGLAGIAVAQQGEPSAGADAGPLHAACTVTVFRAEVDGVSQYEILLAGPFRVPAGVDAAAEEALEAQYAASAGAAEHERGDCRFGSEAEARSLFESVRSRIRFQESHVWSARHSFADFSFTPDWSSLRSAPPRAEAAQDREEPSTAPGEDAARAEAEARRAAAEEARRLAAEEAERREAEEQAQVTALNQQQLDRAEAESARISNMLSEQLRRQLAHQEEVARLEAERRRHEFELAQNRLRDASHREELASHQRALACHRGDRSQCDRASTDDDANRCVSSPELRADATFQGNTAASVVNGCDRPVDVRICLRRPEGWNCGMTTGLSPQGSWSYSSFEATGQVFVDARISGSRRTLARPGGM